MCLLSCIYICYRFNTLMYISEQCLYPTDKICRENDTSIYKMSASLIKFLTFRKTSVMLGRSLFVPLSVFVWA